MGHSYAKRMGQVTLPSGALRAWVEYTDSSSPLFRQNTHTCEIVFLESR